MPLLRRTPKPKISVVVIFYNMRREAARTLYSLTTQYQQGISEDDYEVLVIDSGSQEPLDENHVTSLQQNFRYQFVETSLPTPCQAMNTGIEMARGKTVACLVDGARILSPGILQNMQRATLLFKRPLVYTIGMHLGSIRQNQAMQEGYDQHIEDELLASVDWQQNGYSLFDIACLAGSSKDGFINPIVESNCFSVARSALLDIGGFDEAFQSPGGGLVNLDVFRKLTTDPDISPVMLVGEATFHQFHGGVSTNVPVADSPWKIYQAEYAALRGQEFDFIGFTSPPYLMGELREESRRFFLPPV